MGVSEVSPSFAGRPRPASPSVQGGPPAAAYPGRRLALAAAIAALLVVAAYWDTLLKLADVWNRDPSYSHGFLVPLASVGFAILSWRRSPPDLEEALSTAGISGGAAEIALGAGLHAVAWLMSLLLVDVVALICTIRGTLLLLGGPSLNRCFGFAALFLIFMAPLPPNLYRSAALAMQHFVSVVSTACLETLGIAAFRQGYFVHLAGYTMEVGEACSGLRGLTAVLALGVALGELYRSSQPVRWLLAMLAFPVAVGANCLRVTASGIIMVLAGREWAQGVFHTLEGLATTLIAATGLLALAWMASRWEARS